MKPEIKPGSRPEETIYTHPAQGVIEVTRCSIGGKPATLFNSALKHRQLISIKLRRAQMRRSLHQDWVSAGDTIAEWWMSEAQWATFVSSIGQGGGTPVTLRYTPPKGVDLENVPEIELESVKSTFEGEIKEKAKTYIAETQAAIAKLEKLVNEPGTISRKELKALVRDLAIDFKNFAPNMAFVQSQFAEAMENTIESGKAEIEGFVRETLMRAGMAHLSGDAFTTMLGEPKGKPLSVEDKEQT